MRVALIGAEIEENLALRYLAASLEQAGHEVVVLDFHDHSMVPKVAQATVDSGAQVVGLSMVFTARSRELIALAGAIREHGFGGHLTAGGHFASLHAAELLGDCRAIDTVVHGDGEEPLCELLASLDNPAVVPGLTYRDQQGRVQDTAQRCHAADDLDARPWPRRPRRFHTYLGLPIANLLGSRGCYARCSFCSIRAFHLRSGTPPFRQRRVEAVADEMAALYHERGVRIFNFQDDNFLVPKAAQNLARYRALGEALRERDVRGIAIQAKGRPDSIDEEVIAQLKSIGLFRLFLGIETDAAQGLVTLERGLDRLANHRALAILRRQQIHTCFNLLLFDPDSTIAHIRHNVQFMGQQDYFPLNFCRVEIYGGTPLQARLEREGRLEGDYRGFTYRLKDARAQRAYELFRELFWPRNFSFDGTHFGSMRLDYNLHLLRHFFPHRHTPELEHRAKALLHELNRHSAALMNRILDFAESARWDDPAKGQELRHAIAEERTVTDESIRRRSEEIIKHIEALAAAEPSRRRFLRAAGATAAAAALGAGMAACPKKETHMCEAPPPPDLTHMCEAPPPPDLTQPQPSARMRAELEKALQHYLEHAIWPELSRGFPNPMQLTLKIRLDPARRVQQCYGWQAQGEQEQLANAICGHLNRTPPPLQQVPLEAGFDTMEIPVTLTWPSAAMTPR